MKKAISVLLTFACITAGLCSCSNAEPEISTSRAKRISSSPINPEIFGTWMNEHNGYRFQENRMVSLIIDFSQNGHFTADGEFQYAENTITKENITYDGSKLVVLNPSAGESDNENKKVFFDMERKGTANKDSLDGEYTITDCYFADLIAGELGMKSENLNLESEIEGEKLCITVADCFDYETLGDSLEIFNEYIQYTDDTATALKYKYIIENNTLTMYYNGDENSPAEVYTKVK